MDRLATLFELQAAFDDDLARRRQLSFDTQTWVQKITCALVAELGELLESLQFKWWKDPAPVDRGHVVEELVDVLHFFLSLCLKLGVTPDELFEAYVAKNQENHARQRGRSDRPGYASR